MQAYEQLIPAGDMPNYFVYFTLDPSSIDVNIHPTKTEIKFENEQPIWQILMAATRRRWLNRALSLRLISVWRTRSIFLFTTRSRKVSLVLIRPRKCKWIPVIIRLTLLPIKNRNSIGLNYIKGLRTTEWLSTGVRDFRGCPDRGIAGRGFGSGKTVYGGKQSLLSI